MCMKLGLIEGNILFVDGSKFRANAGKSQSKSKASWEKQLKNIDQHIKALLDECDRIDEQESESLVKMKEELRSKENLKSKINQVIEDEYVLPVTNFRFTREDSTEQIALNSGNNL